MDLLKSRLRWAGRAWPLWLLVVVSVIIAYFANWTPPPSALQFNKVASATLQGLGAFLVLISIDGNLGLFRGHGVFAELREYMLAYPRRRIAVTLEARLVRAGQRVWRVGVNSCAG